MAARTTEPRNVERQMNGEGQRPPGTDPQPAHDAPEPGNARYPQNTPNGQQQQSAEGSGRRRFRRQRRGGRGRGRNRGQHQQNVQAPLDAQGRILDVENDALGEEGGPDQVAQPGEPQAANAGEAQGAQTGAEIPGGPSAPGAPADAQALQQGGQQQARPQQQGQPRQHQQQQRSQQRQEPAVPAEGVLDIDHRGNGRLRSA